MKTEMKTRKYTKEQMVAYLEKHGCSMREAAEIAGASRSTMVRYLEKGFIPTEWLTKIQAELKDRKPEPRKKDLKFETCAVCGKKILVSEKSEYVKKYYTDEETLKKIGKGIPTSGYHWLDVGLKKVKMFPVCEKCNKLISAPKKREKVIKAAVKTKKSK